MKSKKEDMDFVKKREQNFVGEHGEHYMNGQGKVEMYIFLTLITLFIFLS